MIHIPSALVILGLAQAGAAPTPHAGAVAQTASRLVVLAPDAPAIATRGGQGLVVLWLKWTGGGDVPSLQPSDAVGGAHTVPVEHITITQDAPFAGTVDEKLFKATVAIDAPNVLRPGVDYHLSVMAAGAAPVRVRVAESASDAFSVTPQALSHVWRMQQRPCMLVQVANTGQSDISRLSGDLTAASASGLSIAARDVITSSGLSVAPGGSASVDVCPPLPSLAGTYTGTITVTANGRKTERVPIAITTRGPTFGKALWLPITLFGLLVASALWMSVRLESWFSLGGLQRAESAVALSDLAAALRAARLAMPDLRQTAASLELQAERCDQLQREALPPADMRTAIVELTCISQGATWTASVLGLLPAGQRAAAAGVIDSIELPRNADALASYRAAVEKAARDTVPAAAAPNAAGPAPLRMPSHGADPQVLRRRIRTMAALQRGLVFLVATLTAYATFYADKPAFGTSLDYVSVFIWALGVTQAGTQILTQARYPVKP